jgi:hypothetical protein
MFMSFLMLAPYGLEAVLEKGGENARRFLNRFARVPRTPKSSIVSIRKLGSEVGLSASEVDETLSQSGTPLMSNLPWLIVVIFAVIALIIGVNYVINPTYAPGTDYGSIKPEDFVNRKSYL